jgi:hypothetical protein
MRRRRLLLILAIPAVLLTIGAAAVPPMVTMPGESYRGTLPPADAPLRAMADALRAPVVELATHIGERNVSRRARELAAAAEYVAARFKDAGHSVQSQTFQVDKVECRNLEVEIKGRTRQTEIVVVAAHYDSAVGTPAADDNASGVSALLWLARQFGQRRGERTLRLVTDTAMFRYPHYHEASDTPDKIDFERMARVVRGLERVIAELIAAPAAD